MIACEEGGAGGEGRKEECSPEGEREIRKSMRGGKRKR